MEKNISCVEISEMDEFAQDPAQPDVLSFLQTYKTPILLGSVSLLCITVAIVLLIKTSQNVDPIKFSHADEAGGALGTASASLKMMVDVEGAVVHSGIVSLSSDARVEDALVAAGGFTKNADETYVAKNLNRAMKVADGMKLYVSTQDETSHNSSLNSQSGDTSHNLENQLSGQSQNGALVSVNSASKNALDSLPGVGPVTAQKIIDNRPYQTLDDLVAKKAIGPSLFAKLKNMLSL